MIANATSGMGLKEGAVQVFYSLAKPFALAIGSCIVLLAFFYVYFGTLREFESTLANRGIFDLAFQSALIFLLFGICLPLMVSKGRARGIFADNPRLAFLQGHFWKAVIALLALVWATILIAPAIPGAGAGYFSVPLIYLLYLFPALANMLSIKDGSAPNPPG
jgi:hypothetical protein